MKRFVHGRFFQEFSNLTTIGVDFEIIKEFQVDGKIYKLQIWDTSGKERFQHFNDVYMHRTHIILVCLDLTDFPHLKQTEEFINYINSQQEYKAASIPKLLVGLKKDLVDKREVSYEAAVALARRYGMNYCECSAKTGEGVQQVFEEAVRAAIKGSSREILQRRLQNKAKINSAGNVLQLLVQLLIKLSNDNDHYIQLYARNALQVLGGYEHKLNVADNSTENKLQFYSASTYANILPESAGNFTNQTKREDFLDLTLKETFQPLPKEREIKLRAEPEQIQCDYEQFEKIKQNLKTQDKDKSVDAFLLNEKNAPTDKDEYFLDAEELTEDRNAFLRAAQEGVSPLESKSITSIYAEISSKLNKNKEQSHLEELNEEIRDSQQAQEAQINQEQARIQQNYTRFENEKQDAKSQNKDNKVEVCSNEKDELQFSLEADEYQSDSENSNEYIDAAASSDEDEISTFTP